MGLSISLMACTGAPSTPETHPVLDLRYGAFPCDIDAMLKAPPCPAFLRDAQRLVVDLDHTQTSRVATRTATLTVTVERSASESSVPVGVDFRYDVAGGTRQVTTQLNVPYGRWIAVSASQDQSTDASGRSAHADAVFLRIDQAGA